MGITRRHRQKGCFQRDVIQLAVELIVNGSSLHPVAAYLTRGEASSQGQWHKHPPNILCIMMSHNARILHALTRVRICIGACRNGPSGLGGMRRTHGRGRLHTRSAKPCPLSSSRQTCVSTDGPPKM